MEEDSTILSHMSLIGGSIALLMLAKARHNAHDAEAARQKALEGAGKHWTQSSKVPEGACIT